MVWIIIFLSLLFIGIGFLINSKNAENLLAGYNTLSIEKRKNVDLHGYLRLFKKFHLFLGFSLMVFGLGLYLLGDETVLIFFITIYPILAYLIFIIMGMRFDKNPSDFKKYAGVLVLVISLILVIYMMIQGMKENELIISNNNISMEGMYGEHMAFEEIAEIKLVEGLPKITKKSNGFAVGVVRKGYFKTDEGEKVKLILNGDQVPLIYILKKDSTKLYFSSNTSDNQKLFQDLENELRSKNE
jgi:hypothetical protein